VVDVERCLVLDETLQEALQQARGALSERAVQVQVERAQGDDRPALPRRIDLLAGDDGKWVAAPLLGELPRGDVKITVRAMGRPFTFGCDAHTFFQSNRVLCGRLVEVALSRHAEGNPASEDDVVHEVAWDLYSGVGLMALPLAHLAKRVIAVEGDRDAVRHLRRNSRKAAGKIEVVASDVESFLSAQAKSPSEEPEIVVIDPPRSGLSKRALRALMHLQPRSVRYVSCDPATLARDLRVFQERYRVERLAFVDMFAQTSHLESVVWLERED
jgi:23S rRNA (uracil1939-C5)-methyltransferase